MRVRQMRAWRVWVNRRDFGWGERYLIQGYTREGYEGLSEQESRRVLKMVEFVRKIS